MYNNIGVLLKYLNYLFKETETNFVLCYNRFMATYAGIFYRKYIE